MAKDWSFVEPHLIAGAVGSLVSLRFVPGDTWFARLLNFTGGASAAFFVSPSLAPHLGLPGARDLSALAFVVGLLGVVVVDGVVKLFRSITAEQILALWPWRKG